MRTILTILTIGLLLTSCDPDANKPCNCGNVKLLGWEFDDNNDTGFIDDYFIMITNECTGNTIKKYIKQPDWESLYLGSDYCDENTGKW